ncbi:transposase [Halalkalibacter sp. APA_J-10(15)]|uniref:transposase n=1 Tax=Halalkalibacter sp. APA_J-10(15) TaxID=2933805 RepID=UPI001FF225FB|nr:transposase [Halalkalibacter sp. APA_J-10(15)]MCK0473822.1 transposase [Halalkalibacter sp. APA_J-10(15)]
MDDFAWRKGHHYGTLLCDLKTHEPVDLLENREEETVRKWFTEHPSTLMVSRDRSRTFRLAIERANDSIIQISDRFHLVHNLGFLLDRVLSKELPAKMRTNHVSSQPMESSATSILTKQERKREHNEQKKWELAQQVQSIRKKGLPIQRIARMFHLSRRTVTKYIDMKEPPNTQRGYRPSSIDPYIDDLKELVSLGYTVKGIEETLRNKGYKGSYSAIRTRVQDLRRDRKRAADEENIITRKHVRSLFWKPLIELKSSKRETLNQVLARFPRTKELYGFVQLFRDMITTKDVNIFNYLLSMEKNYKLKDIVLFIVKLREEKNSIRTALTYTYSNAILEGNINRLKTIKRLLYGRASLTLLKKRILYRL